MAVFPHRVCWVVLWGCCWPGGDLRAAEPVDYLKQIKPLLAEKCYACHGVLKQESELRLETRQLMQKGGVSGPVIAAGQPDESLLYRRVSADKSERMPPDGEGSPLKPAELDLLRRWIHQGANAPEEDTPVSPQDHWAFRKIVRPTSGSSIDELLEAKRRENSLKTQPPAERSLAIRRLYLDLIGLPPTLEQLQDDRPWKDIVEELLASPQHGERWGRHWMDVWRYTDWYGLGAQLRNSQKHLWHWRDWIIESLNADKGYDRMILEMLAGDELDPKNVDAIRGTGFLARNYYLFNRTTWLDSTIEHTGKAFLGLTLNCAKCHDHKYDPITHQDYYRFRAIFEPHQVRLDPVPGVLDFEKDGLPRVFDDHLDAKTYLHIKGDPNNPDTSAEIPAGVPEIFRSFAPEIEPVSLPSTAYALTTRDYVQADHLKAAEEAVKLAERELIAAKENAEKASQVTAELPPEKSFEVSDDFSHPRPELWEIIGEGWQYQDGTLAQTTPTRDAEIVRLKQPLPRDFEVVCRYTTTGGTTYKSVTFRFDLSEDQKYANFVYTSAYANGPKLQAAYTRGGQHNYPPNAQKSRPIEVGKAYTLKFAVRDRLINVWLNDEFLLAYEYPDRKPAGRFGFSGFDATVAFDSISIKSLSPNVKLTEAGSSKGSNRDPQTALKLAEAKLKTYQAELESLRARLAADQLKYGETAAVEMQTAANTKAATAEALALKAAGEYEALLHAGDAAKRKAAETKQKQAADKLAAIDKGDASYTPLRVAKKALESPADQESQYPTVYPVTSTGRRLALARWMISRENPLTARVAVNHVWLRHFGEPLVESVFDFGLRAKRPEQAELLDFLAVELMDSGWSFKHLHRLIVNSEAYRLSSSTLAADADTLAADPNNQFYWRMNPRRMEAQVVRDSLLSLAGTLDLDRGGPSLEPGNNSTRRSLYFKHSRDHQDQFLGMFDDADHLQCYRRSESIIPQQALALANSKLAIQMSEQIAAKLTAQDPKADRGAFIAVAFETLLGRNADELEQQACLDYCDQLQSLSQPGKPRLSEPEIRSRLVHGLLNHNDFISIR